MHYITSCKRDQPILTRSEVLRSHESSSTFHSFSEPGAHRYYTWGRTVGAWGVGKTITDFLVTSQDFFPSESLFLLHTNKLFLPTAMAGRNLARLANSSLKLPQKPALLQSQILYSQPNNVKRALPQTAGQIH